MKDWWEGDSMFNEFDPYTELQRLKVESINQRNLINQLITNNNKLQDLLVQLSQQHQDIAHEYGNFNRRLKIVESIQDYTPNINTPQK